MIRVSKRRDDVSELLRGGVPLRSAIRALRASESPVASIQTLADLLRRCTMERDMAAGELVRIAMIEQGIDSHPCLCDHLIRLFSSCGSFGAAIRAFDRARRPSVYTWNALISAYVKAGRHAEVFALYRRMQGRDEDEDEDEDGVEVEVEGGGAAECKEEAVNPSKVTYLYLLKSCGSMPDLGLGRLFHHQIVAESGLDLDVAIGTSLIDMYSKCEATEDACRVFSLMPMRNAITLGAMISGYVRRGHVSSAFELFERYCFASDCFGKPNEHMLSCVLKGCAIAAAPREGKMVHNKVILEGMDSDMVIGNSLVDMYAKCGELCDAKNVFDVLKKKEAAAEKKKNMKKKNVVAWGAMLSGYVQQGEGLLALKLFDEVLQESQGYGEHLLSPPLFSCVLKACGIVRDPDYGKLLHQHIVEDGLESDLVLGNALIDMYSKCRSLKNAHSVFDFLPFKNVISWDTLMSGYAQHGHGNAAIMLFHEMQAVGVITPDDAIYACALRACASMGFGCLGLIIHGQIVEKLEEEEEDGLDSVRKALVDMYARCSMLEEARRVFDHVSDKDTVLWSVLMNGYVQSGGSLDALELFMDMRDRGMRPDEFILSCALKACGNVGAAGHGRWMHDHVIKDGLEANAVIGGSLVGMYTCCDSLQAASMLFQRLPIRNEISWGALIAGYAQIGDCDKVVELIKCMQSQGVEPNNAILTSVLAAYSHAGLVGEGFSCFDALNNFVPGIEEYSCMVDLLGRRGEFADAKHVVGTMPVCPDGFAHASLLTCTKTYGMALN